MNTSIATSDLRQLGFVISWAAWGKSLQKKKTSYICACEYWTACRQAALVCTGRHLIAPRPSAHRQADHSVSLQSLSCRCSGSRAAVGRSLFNCLGGRSWGSRWSSLPSPSPWQHLDSPAGTRCWLAHGEGLWSPKRGFRHLTPRMLDTPTHGHS